MDVVYLVRRGERNEELRYSLRSLVNLPHARVWIVGHQPAWVHRVGFIRGNWASTRALNVWGNLRLACECDDLTEDIIVMNDDFFVLRPIDEVPSYCRGPLAEHVERLGRRIDDWKLSMDATLAWLTERGITDPLSYELHIPVVINRRKMLAAMDEVGDYNHPVPPQWRTVYGNLYEVPATVVPDVKLRRLSRSTPDLSRDFLSTDDGTFQFVYVHLRKLFRERSPYELLGRAVA